MAAPKNIYKVWVKSTEKFYSTNKNDSWTSEVWASNAAFDASRRYGRENVEIHMFQITLTEVTPYLDYLEKEKEKREEANRVKEEKDKRKLENYKKTSGSSCKR